MGWLRSGVLGILLAMPVVAQTPALSLERTWIDAAQQKVQRKQQSLAEVARSALPSVVAITTVPKALQAGGIADDAQHGIGSGFVIHPDGWILTSAHVVADAAEVRVALVDASGKQQELTARVAGSDMGTDTALIKVDAGRALPALPLGTSEDVQVADWVIVIGNPFGLSQTVSVGVVSFKGRTDVMPGGQEIDFDYIQTDACINPGSSGGPVLDAMGRVVAVANAVNVSGQGIGFAVPIDIPRAIINDLREHGKVNRGWMGVTIQDLNEQLSRSMGLESSRGVVVSQVVEGGPGARAGLKVGDVITRLGSAPVDRAHALRWKITSQGAGAKVPLTAQRDGRRFHVEVELEPQKPKDTLQSSGVGGAGIDLTVPPNGE